MKVLVSGASGLIGRALRASLDEDGHRTVALTRRPGSDDDVPWDPTTGELDATRLEGFDAIVHLAGEPIGGRWTERKKSEIRASRVRGTRLLTDAISRLDAPPAVLVSSSATGFYGDRGDDVCDEEATAGADFLSDVCQEWEAAALAAQSPATRVVLARTGIVLSTADGALAKLALPLKLGLAGPVGSGRQWWSWISLHDQVRAIRHLIEAEGLEGPVNLVAPTPVRNADFMRAAGRVVGRPTFLRAPAFGLRLAFGEMADRLLLASTRAVPTKLGESGFVFEDPELEPALSRIFDA